MPLAQGSEKMLVAAGAGLAVKAAGSGRILVVVETAGAGVAVKAAGSVLAVKAAGSGRIFVVVETAGAGLAVKAAGSVLAVETAGMPTAVETRMGKLPETGVIGGRVALETAAAVEETVVLGIAEVVPVAITPIACRIASDCCLDIVSRSFFTAFLFLSAAFLAFCEEKTKHSRVHKHFPLSIHCQCHLYMTNTCLRVLLCVSLETLEMLLY